MRSEWLAEPRSDQGLRAAGDDELLGDRAQRGEGVRLVVETDDRTLAMEGANVIYAKSWSSTKHYGDRAADQELRRGLDQWCIDEPWFENAKDDCRFMHCLPVRRGVVVSERVLDGLRSVVIHEARNRMLVQMAVLHQMLKAG